MVIRHPFIILNIAARLLLLSITKYQNQRFPYDLFRSNYEVLFTMKGFQFKHRRVRYYFTGEIRLFTALRPGKI